MNEQLVFFGTGPVALASAESLGRKFKLEAIVTKPDHATHSGSVIEQSLKLWAQTQNTPCFQPANAKELTQLLDDQSFKSRMGVVVDYGIIIPHIVISAFELGIINSHFSLLPKLRGPDPITAAILEGCDTTGVSLMKIVLKLDEGPLLATAEYKIPPTINIIDLTRELTELSNHLLITALPNYLGGKLQPTPQVGTPSYTKKLTKTDGILDWSKPAKQLEREVRAFLGWPGSRTQLGGKDITITKAHIGAESGTGGEHFIKDNKMLGIYADVGCLVIDKLKPAGKNEMSGADFIRGYLRKS